LPRLIGGPRRLPIAYSWCSRRGRRRRGRLVGILGWSLVLIWSLAGILARALVRTLVRILRRTVRRGDLSILRIGRRPCLTPVTLLTRGRSRLGRRPTLLLCHQGRSQRETCTERSGKQPWQTICSH
jgi:hypothetical protein